jgi:hypothetical protein
MDTQPASAFIQRLAIACIGTALLSSIGLGFWDLIHPMFAGPRYTLTPASPVQLWSYAVLQALKPIGFFAGLYGFFLVATREGKLLKIILALAVIGGVMYGVVWLMIAVTGRDDALYIGTRALGSDGHSNGAALFLWLAPLALGIAAWFTRRVGRWQAAWVAAAGLVGSQLFGLFTPGVALIVEGILWLGLGATVYRSAAA